MIATVGPANLSTAEFEAFTAQLLDTEALGALQWAPVVTSDQVAAFTAARRAAGYPDYEIYRLDAGGQRVEPLLSADYYPVVYSEPRIPNQQVLGFDLGSEATRRSAIEDARDTSQFVTTGALTVTQGGTGILVVSPVYVGGVAPDTIAYRRATFLGVAVGLVRPTVLLQRVGEQVRSVDLALALYDRGPSGAAVSGPGQLLAYVPGAVGGTAPPAAADGAVRGEETFDLGGRSLELLAIAGPGYANPLETTLPWAGFLTGLVATVLIGLWGLQRRRSELALRRATSRLQAVVQASPDAYVGLDSAGRIVEWSARAAALFGAPASAVTGRPLDELIAPANPEGPGDGRPSVDAWGPGAPADVRLARGHGPDAAQGEWTSAGVLPLPREPGAEEQFDGIARRPDGSGFPAEVAMVASSALDGTSIVCFVRDGTERQRTMEALIGARELGVVVELTGRIAHDFNNILGVIVGHLDLLSEDLEGIPEAQERAARALAEAMKGRDIIHALQAVARSQGLDPQDVDVAALVPVAAVGPAPTAASAVLAPSEGPAAPAPAPTDVRPETPGAPEPPRPGRRVLVVDDDPQLREVLVRLLEALGYESITARSAPEGYELLVRERPDALVSDILMPGEYGGVELARRARAIRADFPVVLASGFAGEDLEGVRELGVPLLEKPYRKNDLAVALRSVLDPDGVVEAAGMEHTEDPF